MSCDTDLIVGPVTIPKLSILRMRQRALPLESRQALRTWDGTGHEDVLWEGKLGVEIEAEGWVDPGLVRAPLVGALDVSLAIAVALSPQVSPVFQVPTTRRADPAPYGFAFYGFEHEDAPVTMAGDTGTCATVAAAQWYQLHYYPQISAHVEARPAVETDRGTWRWRLRVSEI